jgi:hypothetical protein
VQGRLDAFDGDLKQAIIAEKEARDALAAFANEKEVNRAIVQRESAVAEMHIALERYLELSLASFAVKEAMAQVRADQQDPLVARAGVLFAGMTQGEFVGIETDVGEGGTPVVVGKRANGARAPIAEMSGGTRDQLFLAFRLASLESYGESAEPLPFIADDILVHFDDYRARATLDLLAGFPASETKCCSSRIMRAFAPQRADLRKRAAPTSSISPRRHNVLRAPVRPVCYAARRLWFVTLRRRPGLGGAWKDELGVPVPGQ